jgi:hypothetical protein
VTSVKILANKAIFNACAGTHTHADGQLSGTRTCKAYLNEPLGVHARRSVRCWWAAIASEAATFLGGRWLFSAP